MDYDTHETTALLGISPETLRDWSKQFALLLSPTAPPHQSGQANGTEPRYTENDIILLRQIQVLVQDGQTYEQVLTALNNRQSDKMPKRASRQAARQKAASRRTGEAQANPWIANTATELVTSPITNEQIIAANDQQIAELEEMLGVALRANNERALAAKEQQTIEFERLLEAEQRRADEFSQQIEQLRAENQTLRERLDAAEAAYAPSYSFQLKVLLIMVVVAVLITILLELVLKS